MGSGCGRSASTNSVISPNSQEDVQINQELSPFLALENPYNVNHKYTVFFEIIRDKRVGQGIKITNAYKSKLPLEEIEKKRREFWETRVEGNPEAWHALRSSCEAGEDDAMAILSAMGLKLVNKSLQMAYDSQGYKYDVPIFCINQPLIFDLPKKKELNKADIPSHNIKLKLRTTGQANDVEIELPNNSTVQELKALYLNKINEENINIRMFFQGKELIDKQFIAEYQVSEELVILVFKKKNV